MAVSFRATWSLSQSVSLDYFSAKSPPGALSGQWRRSDRTLAVSSGSENDDETRRLDRSSTATFGRGVGIRLSSFSTAVLIHRMICSGVWAFLLAWERKALISTCREADGMCLRHIRSARIPTMPPLRTLASSFTLPFTLGRFARGFRIQRRKHLNAAFFGRLSQLRPIFDGLDNAAIEDLAENPASGSQEAEASLAAARGLERRVDDLYDVVAELGHHLALAELRLQALEAHREEL